MRKKRKNNFFSVKRKNSSWKRECLRELFTVPMPHIHAVVFQSSEGIVHVRKSDESLACRFARGDVYTILSYVESYKVIQSQKIDKNVIIFPLKNEEERSNEAE